jgi:hypothetical protein
MGGGIRLVREKDRQMSLYEFILIYTALLLAAFGSAIYYTNEKRK